MKRIGLFLTMVLLALACDEGGVLITVPATGSYSFSIKSSQANSNPNNSYTTQRSVDPSALFNQDANLIKSVALDLLTYEISGYTGTEGNERTMNFSLSTELDGVTTEILSVSDIALENGLFTAFQEGNTGSKLSAAQVASLEAIIDNQENFNLIVITGFDGDIESDFTMNVVWEVTASVSQDSN